MNLYQDQYFKMVPVPVAQGATGMSMGNMEGVLLAGYKPINQRRAFRQAGRRDLNQGTPRGPLSFGQVNRILQKNYDLNKALQREREAFGNSDIPQVDGVPTTLTDREMDNRFRGLERKPKRFDPQQQQLDYQKAVDRLGNIASDAHFQSVIDSDFTPEMKAGLVGYQTGLHNSLSTQDQDLLRNTMRNHWDSKMITINARLRPGERLLGINRDGTFKIRNRAGTVRDDDLQREGFGKLEMFTNDMYPRGRFGDFTNEELYRYNVEMFAPQIDPSAAVELIQPIAPLDDEYRPAGSFPPL